MHFQNPGPQGKLVRVVSGAVFDVAVDLRRSSPTFGKWVGVELSAENKRMFWVPQGFAHGFLTLEDDTDFLYKCDAPYAPQDEHSLAWDDPEVGIDWPIEGLDVQLSAKDREGSALGRSGGFCMKVLITGAKGQLGRGLIASAPQHARLMPVDIDDCDLPMPMPSRALVKRSARSRHQCRCLHCRRQGGER